MVLVLLGNDPARWDVVWKRFCLFWGFPYRNDGMSPEDAVHVRANNRARWKVLLLQKLTVMGLMAPAMILYAVTSSRLVLVVLLYLLPSLYIPAVAILAGHVHGEIGSRGKHHRIEIKRLRDREEPCEH